MEINNNKNNNNNDINTNKNSEGISPKIWGPHMWEVLHTISFNYPENPTSLDKEIHKNFYILVGKILPCDSCSNFYNSSIKKGITELNIEVFRNRETLTRWLYNIHEAVNNKLGVEYGITYDDVVKKYESYKSICNTPTQKFGDCINLTKKAISQIKDCPIIPINIARGFINYAKLRGFDESQFYLVNIPNLEIYNIDKQSDIWKKRNKECNCILTEMYEKNIPSIESSGEWQGLPTIEELNLIIRLSSNLSKNKLIKLLNNIENINFKNKTYKIYKLSK